MELDGFCIQNACNMANIAKISKFVTAAIRGHSMNHLDLFGSLETPMKLSNIYVQSPERQPSTLATISSVAVHHLTGAFMLPLPSSWL
jgi:hypothetical protein